MRLWAVVAARYLEVGLYFCIFDWLRKSLSFFFACLFSPVLFAFPVHAVPVLFAFERF